MAEEQKRDLCPNLTSTPDLVSQIGALSVDILNKEKVIVQLWKNIDELSISVSSLTEETQSLNNLKDSDANSLEGQRKRIEKLQEEKRSIEKTLRSEIADLSTVHNEQLSAKDGIIHELEKTLKTIEGEAVINQEEVRKELMLTRNELSTLRQSLKPTKSVKKKKTSTKPARA